MKQSLCCPKCGHNRILYIAQVPELDGQYKSQPAKIALAKKETSGPFGVKLQQVETFGELEAGVCRKCGFTEYYVKDPGSIPVDGEYVREVVGPERPPYR